MSGAPFRELFVVKLDDLGREVAVRGGIEPVAVDAEHLNVDSQLIDGANAVRPHEVRSARPRAGIRSEGRVLDDIPHFGNHAVSVYVDDFHAPPGHRHFPALHGRSRRCRTALKGGSRERVSRQQHSGRRARDGLQEIPAVSHASLHSSFPGMRAASHPSASGEH